MIKTTFDAPIKLALLALDGECDQTHMLEASEAINQFVVAGGELDSLLLSVEKYEYWETFGPCVQHFLVDENIVNHIKKVAVVTDNPVFETGTKLSDLFSHAQLYIYSHCEYDQAMAWLADITEIEVSL